MTKKDHVIWSIAIICCIALQKFIILHNRLLNETYDFIAVYNSYNSTTRFKCQTSVCTEQFKTLCLRQFHYWFRTKDNTYCLFLWEEKSLKVWQTHVWTLMVLSLMVGKGGIDGDGGGGRGKRRKVRWEAERKENEKRKPGDKTGGHPSSSFLPLQPPFPTL